MAIDKKWQKYEVKAILLSNYLTFQTIENIFDILFDFENECAFVSNQFLQYNMQKY